MPPATSPGPGPARQPRSLRRDDGGVRRTHHFRRGLPRVLDAAYLPPVSQGDVYRVAREGPRAIGIIDGFFERVPAVWHKEILWAMSRGIRVFGASSMGALRAAELSAFGMTGVGEIFEAYRDGLLEDDDEVTLVHGDADAGYPAASVAMVDIRATLVSAEEAGVIDATTLDALVAIGKAIFYPDRTYPNLLARARAATVAASELDALDAWLPSGQVSQKRDDALAMLGAMKAWRDQDEAPLSSTTISSTPTSGSRWPIAADGSSPRRNATTCRTNG